MKMLDTHSLYKNLVQAGLAEKISELLSDAILQNSNAEKVDKLDRQQSEVKTDIAFIKNDMSDAKASIAELKTDIAVLKTEIINIKENMVTKVELANLRTELKEDITKVRTELAGVREGIANVTKDMLKWIIPMLLAILLATWFKK
jgi:chromosome segregation ATPase